MLKILAALSFIILSVVPCCNCDDTIPIATLPPTDCEEHAITVNSDVATILSERPFTLRSVNLNEDCLEADFLLFNCREEVDSWQMFGQLLHDSITAPTVLIAFNIDHQLSCGEENAFSRSFDLQGLRSSADSVVFQFIDLDTTVIYRY